MSHRDQRLVWHPSTPNPSKEEGLKKLDYFTTGSLTTDPVHTRCVALR